MVYASTRIKRAAAQAYEIETVETDEFVLHKPEGFLNVVAGDPKYAVEIYSKEYGTDGAERFRKATATLRIDDGRGLQHILADRRYPAASTVSDFNEVIDGVRYRVIAAEWSENGIAFTGLRKLAEHGGKVFDLEAKRLAETTGEAAAGIVTLIDSFRVK